MDKGKEDALGRIIGAQKVIARPEAKGEGTQVRVVGDEALLVLVPGCVRIDVKVPPGFQIVKKRASVELEVDLGGVENLDDHDVVATGAEGGESRRSR